MIKLYQLVATGRETLVGERKSIYSKRVFRSMEQAQAYREEFIKVASTPRDKYDIQVLDAAEPIEVRVVHLELVED